MTWWSLQLCPSMVKATGFPGVALNDGWRTKENTTILTVVAGLILTDLICLKILKL